MANMDIILLERVEKLGNIGEVVAVKPGYARNFLLPQGKALRASEANRAKFEADRERIEKENADKRTAAEAEAKTLEGKQVTLIRQSSDSGQLYGSVSARDIAASLSEGDVKVDKTQVSLEAPIKNLGVHKVMLSLHPEVSVTVEANVARSQEEAEMQREGINIFADDGDDEMLTQSERLAKEALERAERQANAEASGVPLDEVEGEDGEASDEDAASADADGDTDEAAPADTDSAETADAEDGAEEKN